MFFFLYINVQHFSIFFPDLLKKKKRNFRKKTYGKKRSKKHTRRASERNKNNFMLMYFFFYMVRIIKIMYTHDKSIYSLFFFLVHLSHLLYDILMGGTFFFFFFFCVLLCILSYTKKILTISFFRLVIFPSKLFPFQCLFWVFVD